MLYPKVVINGSGVTCHQSALRISRMYRYSRNMAHPIVTERGLCLYTFGMVNAILSRLAPADLAAGAPAIASGCPIRESFNARACTSSVGIAQIYGYLFCIRWLRAAA